MWRKRKRVYVEVDLANPSGVAALVMALCRAYGVPYSDARAGFDMHRTLSAESVHDLVEWLEQGGIS